MNDLDVVEVPRPDGAVLQVQLSRRRADHAPGATLLLLQGQAGSHDWWTGIRDRYTDRFRTVTMDYRGTGATRDPGGALSTELLADGAAAVLDHLNLDQPTCTAPRWAAASPNTSPCATPTACEP